MFTFVNIHGNHVPVHALKPKTELLVSEYRRYVCPECSGHHKDESSAESCCPPMIDVVYVLNGEEYDTPAELVEALQGEAPATFCPVCKTEHSDIEDAARCCMWKTHGPAQRFAITKAVERGESWADAIAASTQGA